MQAVGKSLVLAMAFAGCSALSLASCERRPNVLLITVDTLRADRLGAYGSSTARTPHVDRLADTGVVFEDDSAPMPITRPSHFSIFTSLHPREHGVVDNSRALPPGRVTLAEVFRRGGYDTAAFVGVTLLDERSGAARGFATFDSPARGKERRARDVIGAARNWLSSRDSERPFFLWVHLFDPHLPYGPPRGSWREMIGADAPRRMSWPVFHEIAGRHDGDVPASMRDAALSLYEAEVQYVDAMLGRLFEYLEAGGLRDRTITAFTADHGECCANGIFFEHAGCAYQEAIRVPLILRGPGVPAGARDDRPVSHLDLAPTLLGLAGLGSPPEFRGRDLFVRREARPAHFFFEGSVFFERTRKARAHRNDHVRSVAGYPVRRLPSEGPLGIRAGRWKLLLSDGVEELYDLDADPGEVENLAAARPEVSAELGQALRRWAEEHPVPERHHEPDPESIETLRSLGYVQ